MPEPDAGTRTTPSSGAPPAPTPAPTSTRQLVIEERIDAQLYGGIVVTGVGAALLVVAGIAVSRIDQLQSEPDFAAYRSGFGPDQDACERAEAGAVVDGAPSPGAITDICDEATRWEITNYVAVPGGIAMLGMGLYMTLTSDTAQEDTAVSWAPTFGPGHLGAVATGRF